MKRTLFTLSILLYCCTAFAQQYSFLFQPQGLEDTMLYVGRHYRDEVQLIDSAARGRKGYHFRGRRPWERGIYVLVRQDRTTRLTDFLVDDSRTFTLSGDSTLSAASLRVKGSKANSQMYRYEAKQQAARHEDDSLRRAGDTVALKALATRMLAYEDQMRREHPENLHLQIIDRCAPSDVPDSVADKPLYYRAHYWDPLFENASPTMPPHLLYSRQLFDKMNYFFFGLLYRADADTICNELDRLMARIGGDTAMQRYVLQFIEPRYYRASRNIGWDRVWCHIASEYILKGRCQWMRESETYLARKNYERISQSIIGAHGQELWMIDTTQIDSPEHWHSSHRQPTPYVILWFWDPDCHHCQEHSEELKALYDQQLENGQKRFEVYAVGYESDVEKWKRYVKEHQFRWINVGGPNVNIDYQEAYNVHGAPTMIILNERRDIIMNKVLPIKSLTSFLDNYEATLNTKH